MGVDYDVISPFGKFRTVHSPVVLIEVVVLYGRIHTENRTVDALFRNDILAILDFGSKGILGVNELLVKTDQTEVISGPVAGIACLAGCGAIMEFLYIDP